MSKKEHDCRPLLKLFARTGGGGGGAGETEEGEGEMHVRIIYTAANSSVIPVNAARVIIQAEPLSLNARHEWTIRNVKLSGLD